MAFFSLSLFASCRRFWTDLQKFFCVYFIICYAGRCRIRLLSLDTQANVFVKATLIVKFCMCEYDIPYALEKMIMAGLSVLITWSSKITWQTKTIISPLPQCLKPWMITHIGGLLSIEWHDPLIMQSSQITRQTKTIISSLWKCLSPRNLEWYWLTLRGSYPCSHTTLYLRGLTTSRSKLKMLYLYYHNTYGQQTWYGSDIQ